MKIEAIPNFVVGVYAFIARKSGLMRDIRSRVVEEVCAVVSSGKILDVGTGPGYLPFEIARKAHALEIVGIDLSPGMVALARKTTEKIGLAQRVSFQVANASSLPFEDKTFDLVVSTLSLHHWSAPAADFKEENTGTKRGHHGIIKRYRTSAFPEDRRPKRGVQLPPPPRR